MSSFVPVVPAANTAWQADGFLNFTMPGVNGKPQKIGAIPLRDLNKAGHVTPDKALREWLEADIDNIAKLVAKMTVTYNSAIPAEGNGYDLSDKAPVTPTPVQNPV